MIPYYYGYMIKLTRENKTHLGNMTNNRMEERISQWDGFPLFFALLEEVSVEATRGYCEY